MHMHSPGASFLVYDSNDVIFGGQASEGPRLAQVCLWYMSNSLVAKTPQVVPRESVLCNTSIFLRKTTASVFKLDLCSLNLCPRPDQFQTC
jgi:hypothetical protein